MSESASTPAIKSASTFASFLESFTSSAEKTNGMWNDDALLDDVATISYEQALRSHSRVPPAASLPMDESRSATAPADKQTLPVASEKKRKTASITMRLTQAEETQLHERAAAAQLSVSAYLRSCIFEAESLRAQVKEALARMSAAAAVKHQHSSEVELEPAEHRRFHFFTRWSRRNQTES